ncbi:MAG: efflux RND transporter periplasmic adaptor subunit [Magnetococcales bacterium]|nr:efflux RND transporter periplasmic adaptor subunit [Magnetococcales bacterium]
MREKTHRFTGGILTVFALFFLLTTGVYGAEATVRYTCPMHPHYIAEEVGTCPICGMDLVPLESGPATTNAEDELEQRQAVTIPAETIQNMGVRYGQVEEADFGRRIRSFGMVMENERAQNVVSSRVPGWVEKLRITAVGDPVKHNEELYRLFSPELIAAQRDYLSAINSSESGRIRSTALRLESLGVDKRVLLKLRSKRSILEKVPFYAAYSGLVSRLDVRQGTYIKPGQSLATIQDYGTVWINTSVAEKDLARINLQTAVQVIMPHLPGRTLTAKLDYIYPTIDATSRTGTVRLVLDNADRALRPGAYADVVFEIGIDRRLAIPTEALLKSSEGNHVIVALGEGRFQPRSVRIGLSSNGYTEILAGLKNRERIVVSGQFMIDSESALKESFRKLQRIKTPLYELVLSANELAMVDHLIDAALYIHEALIDGYNIEEKMLQPARGIFTLLKPKFGTTKLGSILKQADESMSQAQNARTETEWLAALNQLTDALLPWILEGAVQHYQNMGLILFRDKNHGQLWLQTTSQPFNPYGGKGGVALTPSKSRFDPPNSTGAGSTGDNHVGH